MLGKVCPDLYFFCVRDLYRSFGSILRRVFKFCGVATALLFFLALATAQAQTTISGAISANTRWTVDGSPYLISGEVQVQNNAILSIDAGVSIFMGTSASLTVQAGGVRAAGTQSKPIQVLSDKRRLGQAGAPGDWRQWVFNSGTLDTQLDHVLFEHGRGLLINGCTPVLNNLDIRNHLGAAITMDLTASPTGVGNQASGNTINGIAVPAGDVAGNVKWGVRGIPYVLSSGVLSIGASPSIVSVSPNTVQQGQTVTLTLDGTRLDPLSRVVFSKQGLGAVIFSGGSAIQKHLQLTVAGDAPTGMVDLRAVTDAGEAVFANAFSVTQPKPVLDGLNPVKVTAGVGPSEIVVSGQNFVQASEVLFNSASVTTRYVSTNELVASLPKQTNVGTLSVQVRSPDAQNPGQSILSNALSLTIEAPIPPVVSFDPTPIALPPDNKPHQITLRLSKADYRDNVLSLSVADPTKATVSPATVTIAAGQTEVKVNIVPLANGTSSLIVNSATLSRSEVPLFVTADFRGASTAYATPVGVTVEVPAIQATQQITLTQPPVGIAVGAVLTDVTPSAWALGGNTTLTISGANIPSSVVVAVVPATGIALSAPQVSADGKQLQVVVTTASDAQVGPRKLKVRGSSGNELVFADPAKSVVRVMAGLPSILSIDPTFALPGTTIKLKVRGKNLEQGLVRLVPDSSVNVDAAPQINGAGDELVVSVDVLPGAQTGPRVVQVVTPAGVTASLPNETNTLLIASSKKELVTPVASPVVGVLVGDGGSTPVTRQEMPLSSMVGVMLGAGVTEVAPNSGVIGNDVTMTVRGIGLGDVTAIGFLPSTGLSIQGTPNISGDGKELTFTVHIDGNAPLNLRRLVVSAGGKPLAFTHPADANFLVSAPIPELASVSPTILQVGQSAIRMSVRGKNMRNIQSVRIEPAAGITISGPFESNADGTQLDFTVAVSANAVSGERAVVIATPAGESSNVVQAGNIVRVASQLGATYANILSAPVGVVIGNVNSETRIESALLSAAVGIVVAEEAVQKTNDLIVPSAPVGVLLGSVAQNITPDGWLRGATGNISVTGVGLETVAAVTAKPATGLLFGQPVVSGNGGALTVSVSVAPGAEEVPRELRLVTADGRDIPFAQSRSSRFGIGSLPTMTSVSPIVLEQGKGAVLNIRGSNLKGVIGADFSGGGVTVMNGQLAWIQDAYGELLSVSVLVDSAATLGGRVIRLRVQGGVTTAEAGPANTIAVVVPQ